MQRRTAYTGSSASRRRERRAHLQPMATNDFNTTLTINRPTPSKVELASKRKAALRADTVTLTHIPKPQASISNCCLPQVAMYRARYRKQTQTVTAQ